MYFETVFNFYVFLYHFIGHSLFWLVSFCSLSNIIKQNFSLTLPKLNFYFDMSTWLFVESQYYRLCSSPLPICFRLWFRLLGVPCMVLRNLLSHHFVRDSRTTDSACASLSKLRLISSSMIGSLNLMDLSHWPLG